MKTSKVALVFSLAVIVGGVVGCATPPELPTRSMVAAPPSQAWFFPAMDWETVTKGGRNGQIIRVTTLASDGPGSLREALNVDGPRIIVFEVGGVIDLGRKTLNIDKPFVTVAGQTAPSPGITLIRGGIDIRADDVILQHLRVRPGDLGEARGSGWGEDAVSTQAAANVIVDHCSLTWGTDENLSASGPRFTGRSPEEWRQGTSHNILFSHNLLAEGLADSTHPKFEHSKGSLIHDNVSDIIIYANLYAHNVERSPLFKGGVRGAIVNNFIYNPGQRAVHYNLQALEWGEVAPKNGRMALVGNIMRGGASTAPDLPLLTLGGDGDLELYAKDNVAVDRFGEPVPEVGRYTTGPARIVRIGKPPEMSRAPVVLSTSSVERYVLTNVGARPWDRDSHDVRVLADTAEGRGKIIDSQAEVGGYPAAPMTKRAFDPSLWNMDTMTPKSPAALDRAAQARGT